MNPEIPILFVSALFLQQGARRWRLIAWLSPAFWAYALGIALGALLSDGREALNPVLEGSVALAIPLMLFSADLKAWWRLAGPTLRAVLSYFPVVLGLSLLGQVWLGQPPEAAALAAAVYTGGTANMAAVNVAIGGGELLFGTYNLADLMVGGALLPFLLALGPRLMRLWLEPAATPLPYFEAASSPGTVQAPRWQQALPRFGRSLLLGIAALVISAGVTWLLMGELHGSMMLMMLTLCGLGGAAWPQVRELTGTFEAGEYFFLVFCAVAGAMVDLQTLLTGTWTHVAYMGFVVLGTLLVHSLLARLLRIDADTTLITQVAGLYGPPFIGPMASAMRNREMVVTGLTIGVANLALGNLAGLLVWNLLG